MDTALPALWASALAFGNLFAAFWLLRVWFIANPGRGFWRRVVQPANTRTTTCLEDGDTAEEAVEDLSKLQPLAAPVPVPHTVRHASRSLIEPMVLSWRGLGCSYPTAAGAHVVLSGVTGSARPGGLHALLGPSGAGKSSLLDILAQRKRVGRLTGQVLVNGKPASRRVLVSRSAYVPQEDNFMPILTAHETLGFFANLLLPPALSDHARAARTDEVLAVLGLSHCARTLVGGQLPGGMSLRGLSGGERKRLAVAVGLLAAPSLLFLDEPTSGLDSFAALTVMRYIRAMASEAGHVVMASIHQPRAAIWSMFDEVTVLSQGYCMFCGPCDDMVPWFTQHLPLALQPQPQPPHQDDHHLDTIATSMHLPRRPSQEGQVSLTVAAGTASLPRSSAGAGGGSQTGGGGALVVVYVPEVHGVPSDWVLDVVSLGFGNHAAQKAGSTGCDHGPDICSGFSTLDQLQAAATAFSRHQASQLPSQPGHHHQQDLPQTSPSSSSSLQPWLDPQGVDNPPTSNSLDAAQLEGGSSFSQTSTAEDVEAQMLGGTSMTVNVGCLPRPVRCISLPVDASFTKQHSAVAGAAAATTGVVARCATCVLPVARRTATATATISIVRHHSARVGDSAAVGGGGPGCPTGADDESDWGEELALAQQLASSMEALYGAHASHAPHAGAAKLQQEIMSSKDVGSSSSSSTQGGHGDGSSSTVVATSAGLSTADIGSALPSPTCKGQEGRQGLSSAEQAAQGKSTLPGAGGVMRRMLTFHFLGLRWRVLRAWVHLRALLWREAMNITRNPADVAGRMLTFSWIAVLAGLVFYNIPATLDSAQLRLNVLFSNTAFVLLMPYISMSLYTADRQYWLADASSRLYSPATYYAAKVAATVPFQLLCSVVYTLIVYGMTGLRHGVKPTAQSTTITSMLSLIAVQVLHAASTLASNQDMAFMIALLWTALNLLLSGFFITYDQFAISWLSQLRWLSAQGYAFEGLARAELQGVVYNCSQGVDTKQLELLPSLLPTTAALKSTVVISMLKRPGANCEAHADALLQYFGLERSFNETIGILLAYWGGMHVVTYLALLLASRQEKR